jgi:cell division protein FtsN
MPSQKGRSRSKSDAGGRRIVVVSLVSLAALSLTFASGMLVGRQWNRSAPPPAQAEKGKKAGPNARGSLRDSQAERAGQMREKLTFYQALPAPLGSTPPPLSKPAPAASEPARRIQEPVDHPKDASKPADEAKGPEKSSVTEPRPPTPDRRAWTVQVGAYRTRELAEEYRKSLSAAGHDAYVTAFSSSEGTVRYRVRVGSFTTRNEAEKTASRLKAERSLNPFVTPRPADGQ